MSNIQESVTRFIHSDRYSHTSIHYDLNALKLRLYADGREDLYLFLYIYHPWRIMRNGAIVNSSNLCPMGSPEIAKDAYSRVFAEYAGSTNSLSKRKVVEITIQKWTNAPLVRWDDDTTLEAFSDGSADWLYHIYDKVNSRNYDVFSDRIEEDC